MITTEASAQSFSPERIAEVAPFMLELEGLILPRHGLTRSTVMTRAGFVSAHILGPVRIVTAIKLPRNVRYDNDDYQRWQPSPIDEANITQIQLGCESPTIIGSAMGDVNVNWWLKSLIGAVRHKTTADIGN